MVLEEGEVWEREKIIQSETDYESLKVFADNLVHATWLFPLKGKHSGYDLVCLLRINGQYLLRFVQVIFSVTYSLKLQHFKNVADAMSSVLKCPVRRIEIVMMLPTEVRQFQLYPWQVKDAGALESYKVGNSEEAWKKSNEHNLVRTLHFKRTHPRWQR